MGYFYSLRGWLEFGSDDFDRVIGQIKSLQQRYLEDDQASHYMSGWCWPSKPFNWTVFIFYGGDVKLPGLDLFETVLKAVCDLGCKVEGDFHAQGEDGAENLVYRIVTMPGPWNRALPCSRATSRSRSSWIESAL